MKIAIVGCGYVADYYMQALPSYPELELVGITDKSPGRLKQFADFYNIANRYSSLQHMLEASGAEVVLNLTDPRSHYEISLACIRANKHVYSEKPLAMDLEEAKHLVAEAQQNNLQIVSAPCSLLTGAAQTMWQALREGLIGKPIVAYANMDDGMVFRHQCHLWKSDSGAYWPHKDEFEVGVTLEHAGYVLTWLAAFLGPVKEVVTVGRNYFPEKVPGDQLNVISPDITLTTLVFVSGAIARVSCSLIGEADRKLHIYGTDNESPLICDDIWHYDKIYTRRAITQSNAFYAKVFRRLYKRVFCKLYPKIQNKRFKSSYNIGRHMDFARGPAELVAAIAEKRTCRLSPEFSLHITEIALAMSNASENGEVYHMTTSFSPIEPMPMEKTNG